jgi:hypothetical protein
MVLGVNVAFVLTLLHNSMPMCRQRLFYCTFQQITCYEFRYFRCRDLNRFPSSWVLSHPALPLRNRDRAESRQGQFVAFLQTFLTWSVRALIAFSAPVFVIPTSCAIFSINSAYVTQKQQTLRYFHRASIEQTLSALHSPLIVLRTPSNGPCTGLHMNLDGGGYCEC